MTVKALTFKTNEKEIAEIKKVASVFHISVGKLLREAVREYVSTKKQSPFYRLTADIEEASPEESAEILAMIESLTDEDREIVRVDHITC